jgi:hypothetical protein
MLFHPESCEGTPNMGAAFVELFNAADAELSVLMQNDVEFVGFASDPALPPPP